MTIHIDNDAYKDIEKIFFDQVKKNLNKKEELKENV